MSFYSTRQGRWISRAPRAVDTGPNPYEEGTRGYAERHRETVIEYPDGLTRIDLGEPIVRAGAKVRTARPANAKPAATPAPEHPEPVAPAHAAPPERDWRNDYGIARKV